jgi:hypothetical protein
MERREFLKMFGLGAAALGVAAATMSPAQAASSVVAPASGVAPSVDDFIRDLAESNGGEGEFAWHYRRRHYYYFRPRYYVRRRRCWLRATPWGWRRVCSW